MTTEPARPAGAEPAPLRISDALKTQAEQRAELRRMRTIATMLLVLMAAIYLLMRRAPPSWAWAPYLGAFAEAGMVGACADWFAIVALFRRPLGLPIPHTGIVPNNKDRIGKALGNFITNNFLTAAVMNERLARIDMVSALARWLSEPANAKRLGDYVALQLPQIARSLPLPRIGELIGTIAQQAAQAIPAAPVASKLLAIVWAQGEAQALLAQAIEQSEAWLAGNKDVLTDKVSERSSRWIPKWIDRMIAEKVLNGLLGTLAEMRDPLHPWRVELRKTVEKLIAELATDPQMRARAEDLKAELLASPLLIEQAKTLWTEVETGLVSGLPAHSEAIGEACARALRNAGTWLQEDEERKAQLNRRIRIIGERFLLPYRVEIGAYIERVVRNWDSATLVDRLELQVGKDLQYIRINGTLVGGLVGLLIYAVSQWIAQF
jgi:uncharacterized membrane-anchored protein YjiN (DUF445 family)